jgi:hypothetical protein
MSIEPPEIVAARIRRALPHVPADRIVVAPDDAQIGVFQSLAGDVLAAIS